MIARNMTLAGRDVLDGFNLVAMSHDINNMPDKLIQSLILF